VPHDLSAETARPSPLGALAKGLLAGAIGTGAMTAYQTTVQKARSGGEQRKPPRNWGDAPAPARLAQRVLSGVFKQDVPLERMDALTNGMHWLYGTAWGGLYGLVQGTVRAPAAAHGLGFGTFVWGMSYAMLVPAGLYKKPWQYPPAELAVDASYHLVYGLAVAEAYEQLDR
jgi:hypothetical protein